MYLKHFAEPGGLCCAAVVVKSLGSLNLCCKVILMCALKLPQADFVKGHAANAEPFTPFGVRGLFNGAAIVFFSFIGFDAVATSAEEVSCCTSSHL